MNLDMSAHLQTRSLDVVLGLPNTTGKTQESSQSCGPFKSNHHNDLHTALASQRFEKKKHVNVDVLREHGGPTPEKIKEHPAQAMQKLCEWKFNKKSTEALEKLTKVYLNAPISLKEHDWSMSEEIKLKELLTEDMCTKDTALSVQLKQTAKAITNNVIQMKNRALNCYRLFEDHRAMSHKETINEDQCSQLQ